MKTFHPENLIEGKQYRFKYKNVNDTWTEMQGIFLRMQTDVEDKGDPLLNGTLWLWFKITDDPNDTYECPIDYSPSMLIEEVH
jgi:hypothetical protein